MKHLPLLPAAVSLLLASCLLDTPEVGGAIAGRCEPADSNAAVDVSFATQILPIFERTTSPGCSCHQPSSSIRTGLEIGGLDLSSFESLMRGGNGSGSQIVISGAPCDSILVQKVGTAPPFGGRMPQNGPPFLSLAERQLISDWIAEGAQDN